MPSASPELRVRWDEMSAIAYLRECGWTYSWKIHCWLRMHPRPPVNDEIDAATYLVDEWDFGWFAKENYV